MVYNPDRFKLTESEHEEVYQAIEQDAFLDTTPSSAPQAIILGGQPGAGKSGLLERSYRSFEGLNAVKINGDDFRQWHLHRDAILEEDESAFAALTDPDVRPWTKRLFDTTIETKRNVIFEGTMRVKTDISNTMDRLQQEGYSVKAQVIAAHERQSVVGIHLRYEWQKKTKGHGRMAPLEVHDQAYTGVLDTIDHIERNKLASKIELYNRNGECVYENSVKDGEWDKLPRVREALEAERNRPPSLDECHDHLADWKEVIGYMQDRDAAPEDLQAVRGIAKGFIAEIHPTLATDQNPVTRATTAASIQDIFGESVELAHASEAEMSLTIKDPSKDRSDEFTPN